jgi:hypothetical protein
MPKQEVWTVEQYREHLAGRGVHTSRRQRTDEYDSEAEKIFATNAALVMWAGLQVVVHEVRHHPVTFHLPGNSRYTPDFRIRTSAGNYMIEIKPGDRISKAGKVIKPGKNRRDARSKLRAAAELFPEYTFIEARLRSTKEPLNWELETI